jgi:hypothetical protein
MSLPSLPDAYDDIPSFGRLRQPTPRTRGGDGIPAPRPEIRNPSSPAIGVRPRNLAGTKPSPTGLGASTPPTGTRTGNQAPTQPTLPGPRRPTELPPAHTTLICVACRASRSPANTVS